MKRDISHHLCFRYEQLVFYLRTPPTATNVVDPNLRASGSPGGSLVKNPPANAGDKGSIPWLGRSLEKEMATHSSTLAWEISWTEEPGPLQSMGSQKSLTGLSDETTQTQVFWVQVHYTSHWTMILQEYQFIFPNRREGGGKSYNYSYTNICFSSSTLRLMLSTL